MNGAVGLHSCTSSSSSGSTSSTTLGPAVDRGRCPAPGRRRRSPGRPRPTPRDAGRPTARAGERRAVRPAAGAAAGARQRPGERRGWASETWSKVSRSGSGPGGSGVGLGGDQRRIGTRGAPYRLRRVVDQDVQRAVLGHGVGERDHLGRVAQVDADDPQPVQPVGAVRHGGEAADRVGREPGGDGGVRAVPEQPQRDVHADLGAAAGQQRPPAGEVGAGVAAGAVDRGAVRAQLVVERVDLRCSRVLQT